MRLNRIILFLLFLFVLGELTIMEAKVLLPSVIGSNMVLKQNSNVMLWGKTAPNAKVKVYTSWDSKTIIADSNHKGDWSASLFTPSAGGPYEILFIDNDTLKIDNVYLGEVWLCSGQSNMEMPVSGFYSQPVENSLEIITSAKSDIPIRLFVLKQEASKVLKEDVIGSWSENTPENVSKFSAVGYTFGKLLYDVLKTPIGLINSSWGGSNVEAWLPYEICKMYPNISLEHLYKNNSQQEIQKSASLLYNSMLYPLRKMALSGVIWYQGEANRLRSEQYKELFPLFVENLRSLFNFEDMPFYYVQIAPFCYNSDKNSVPLSGVLLRESQMKCENIIPNSKMAVISDLGEEFCVHPSKKTEVGERLAYLALSNTYNIKGIDAEAPIYTRKKIEEGKIILTFDKANKGLTSYNKELENFEICGSDSVFYKAKASIRGNKVVVWSDMVSNPIAVRYAFKNFVKGDLFGTNGIPVSSFRTDF